MGEGDYEDAGLQEGYGALLLPYSEISEITELLVNMRLEIIELRRQLDASSK